MAEKEYIEREKLNDMLEDFCVNETFYDAMQTIPAADVAPVRHGYWKRELMSPKIGLYGYTCSNCNKLIYVGIERYMTYCGNCGAKMDGDEQGNDT